MSPTVEYVCPRNHWVASKMAMTTCPVHVKGRPCEGDLKRIGAGSRGPRPLVAADTTPQVA